MSEGDDAKLEAARLEARWVQYRLFSDTAETLLARRAEANRFYLTLNLAVVGAIGYLFSGEFVPNGPGSSGGLDFAPSVTVVACVFSVAGLVISQNWWNVIRSHSDILALKFVVIHDLETALPSQPFRREADVWRNPPRDAQGAQMKPRRTGHFERRLPVLFSLFYLLVLSTFAFIELGPAIVIFLGG